MVAVLQPQSDHREFGLSLMLVWSKAQKVPGSLSHEAGLREVGIPAERRVPAAKRHARGLLKLELLLGLLRCTQENQ